MTGALACSWRPRTRELFRDIIILMRVDSRLFQLARGAGGRGETLNLIALTFRGAFLL
jgi:hypothetical protein